jgi:alpha-tubulin suppressor-like RCC1 family protein
VKPVQVALGSVPTAVSRLSAEGDVACALVDGQAVCWGSGGGLFTNFDGAPPRAVANTPSDLTMLDVGKMSVCVGNAASVYCWGLNFQGGMGTGSELGTSPPAKVQGLPDGKVEALSTDGYPAAQCAIIDGLAYCWGFQEVAQLGLDRRLGDYLLPVAAPLLGSRDLRRVSGGPGFSCMLDAVGAVSCWGEGANGQLGNGAGGFSDAAFATAPTAVLTDLLSAPVDDLGFGAMFALARANGKVYRWGNDFSVQWSEDHSPVEVTMQDGADPGTVRSISTATTHACAIVDGGSEPGVYCWGRNDGKRVVGTPESDDDFVHVPTRITLPAGEIRDLDTNYDTSCVVVAGDLYCWGHRRISIGPTRVDVGGFHDFQSVVTYESGNVCAVREDSLELWCFRDDPSTAVKVGSGITGLRSGVTHVCGLKLEEGEQHLFCWGYNGHGQLGTGDRKSREKPVRVQGLVSNVSQFDLSDSDRPSTCAKDSEGWKCWGNNTSRQIFAVPYTASAPTLVEPWQ